MKSKKVKVRIVGIKLENKINKTSWQYEVFDSRHDSNLLPAHNIRAMHLNLLRFQNLSNYQHNVYFYHNLYFFYTEHINLNKLKFI